MKIAVYVSKAMYPREAEGVVSGHVQIALRTAEILAKQGHNVTVITTKAPEGYGIPGFMDSNRVRLQFVTSGTQEWPKHKKIDLLKAPRHFRELRKLLSRERYDALHFFGSTKVAYLLAVLKVLGVEGESVVTFINYRAPGNMIHRLLGRWILVKGISCCITSTCYVKRNLERCGFRSVFVNRPGLAKLKRGGGRERLRMRPEAQDLVLFWRDAEYSNGVDICMEAFRRLSKEFAKADFVFAVRPRHTFEEKLAEMDRQYENIHLLLYPYRNGVTIAKLLASSTCVVMPFRKLSLNPQMALLETLWAGKALVTTRIESNEELVDDQQSIYFVESENVDQTYSAIKLLLEDRDRANRMGEKGRSEVLRKWNWERYREKLRDIYAGLGEGKGRK